MARFWNQVFGWCLMLFFLPHWSATDDEWMSSTRYVHFKRWKKKSWVFKAIADLLICGFALLRFCGFHDPENDQIDKNCKLLTRWMEINTVHFFLNTFRYFTYKTDDNTNIEMTALYCAHCHYFSGYWSSHVLDHLKKRQLSLFSFFFFTHTLASLFFSSRHVVQNSHVRTYLCTIFCLVLWFILVGVVKFNTIKLFLWFLFDLSFQTIKKCNHWLSAKGFIASSNF